MRDTLVNIVGAIGVTVLGLMLVGACLRLMWSIKKELLRDRGAPYYTNHGRRIPPRNPKRERRGL